SFSQSTRLEMRKPRVDPPFCREEARAPSPRARMLRSTIETPWNPPTCRYDMLDIIRIILIYIQIIKDFTRSGWPVASHRRAARWEERLAAEPASKARPRERGSLDTTTRHPNARRTRRS